MSDQDDKSEYPRQRKADRRSGIERRQGGDRRKNDRRVEPALEIARQLPDEFLRAPGNLLDRTRIVVERHWRTAEPGRKTSLAQALAVVFEDLQASPRPDVKELHRSQCQEIVRLWIER